MNNAKSRKMFAFEHVEGNWRTRVRVPEDAGKYDPMNHFQWFEESDYLNTVLKGIPYSTLMTDDRDEMESILQNGFKSANTVWVPFFAFWKDQEGRAILVPEGSGVTDLKHVGVITHMKSPADFMKVGKYVNRLFAALPKNLASPGASFGIWGKEVAYNPTENESIVLLDGPEEHSEDDRSLAIRYVDLSTLSDEAKALVDGCIVVSEKAVRALSLSPEPKLGMAWRGTFGTERGLGKGHILYKSDMNVDVVIYGPKKIVVTDRFFFGSMGELHVGIPHTDRQAVINFHMHKNNLLVDLAKSYMRSVIVASRDEASLRRLLLRYTRDMQHSEMSSDEWILRKALTFGVSYLRFPGLYRRVVRYLMTKVMQCDQRSRIPMDSIAHYGYVLPDPNVIDSEGDVYPERGIPAGHIVFPDVNPGVKVVCYRQPSENTNAWYPLIVAHRPEYRAFAGRGICLLGRGAHKVLGRLGGGDMDDQFVIIHDPKWVEHFHSMRPYPETEKLSSEVTTEEEDAYNQEQTELNAFTEELLDDIRERNQTQYTVRHVSWQIELAKNARAGIGPVVNFGMMDLLLSDPDHLNSMLADIRANFPEEAEWLAMRDKYVAAVLMTNLEIVIDGNVKDTTLLSKLGDVSGTIKKFHHDCRVYPASMVPARVPLTKLEQNDFIAARSLTCHALQTITRLRDRLQEVFVEREWSLVAPADKDLRNEYPFERELNIRVRGEWVRVAGEWQRVDDGIMSLMDVWGQFWRDFMSGPDATKTSSQRSAYLEVSQKLQDEVLGEDDDTMRRIAVEIYFNTYRNWQSGPKLDEVTGKARNYNDGLLWNPIFANHFIDALRHARLSGYYVVAEILPWFRRRLLDTSVFIAIRNRMVYIQAVDDQFSVMVGFVIGGKAPDGRYRMDNGLIEIRHPKEICLPEGDLLLAQKPMTRLFPTKQMETETKPVTEPEEPAKPVYVLSFSGLLQKAMDLLKGGK